MIKTPRGEERTSETPLRPVQPPPVSRYEPPLRDVHEFIWIVWRYKWSILLVTLACLGIALFLTNRQTPLYESRTRVLVLPIEDVPGTETAAQPNLATERELASSFAVAEAVAEDLGITDGTGELLDELQVELLADTEILEIRYRHADPAVAEQRAQAFAENYIGYRRTTATAKLAASAEDLDRQIRNLRRRFETIQQELQILPAGDPNAIVLRNEAALIQGQLLQRQLARLDLETASVNAGDIVEPASLPSSPVVPNHFLNGGVGLAAGLVLGVGSMLARDRVSERLRSPAEVEDYLAAPVIGWIPRISAWRRKNRPLVISLERWRSPAAESYRSLRTNLLSASTISGAKSIVVTSPNASEGKSATVANLAVVLARSGKRVTVVSADLRRPRLHEFFGMEGSVGLTDVLSGRMHPRSALRKFTFATSPWTGPAAEPLWVLPSGDASQEGDELLTSEGLRRLVEELERASDIVLIDVPAVLPVTDALVVASVAGGVLLVIGPRSATRSAVVAARQRLDRVGARVLGAVLNGQSTRGEGYGSGYGY
jgi:tyrosine-protein kinase